MIPVARPLLPGTDALIPYLRRIDATRIYANWGPLNALLERRLGERFGAEVVTVSSATDGLTCALRAVLEDRPADQRAGLCLMPSWTFVASPQAALAAGLTPCFLDVDPASWALTPDLVAAELLAGLSRQGGLWRGLPVSAVMAVAPFGLQIDAAAWDDFAARTGIPVVIDAAAAFDGLQVRRAPAVVSLHATKTVSAGEGGFVATRDADLARRVKRVANFGFFGARLAEVPGTNAKLSEYHAAVALASLDGWDARRGEWLAVGGRLREALAPHGVGFQDGFAERWVASMCMVRLPARVRAAEASVALGLHGVATRAWWGQGCHTSPAFEHFPRRAKASGDMLAATAILAETTLGIPFFTDLSADQIATIAAAFAATRELAEAPRRAARRPVEPGGPIAVPPPLAARHLADGGARGRRARAVAN